MSRTPKSRLLLTQHALRDIDAVRDYSTARWGREAAEKYLDELDAALARQSEHPDLLQLHPDFHNAFRFYRVNKHVFVCETHSRSILLLTVLHASMDIPNRLAELQPTLAAEVDLLHRQLEAGKPSRRK